MPEVRPWARVMGDVNVNLRRGAWYEVMRLTADAAIVEVNLRPMGVPRAVVEIQVVRPKKWSTVARPYDAVDLPINWGSSYGVCPRCSHRAPLKGSHTKMGCPRCGGVFELP